MMNTFSMSTGTSFFWLHIHWVFVGISMFAFIAAIIWYSKHASAKQAKNILTWALIIGIVGMIATSALSAAGWTQMMSHHGAMREYNHQKMIEGNEDSNSIHEMMEQMMEERK
jgi:uncharacterized membrane protein